jgi:hypothetical protein
MQPGTHNDNRKNAKVKRPPCGIRGWSAAWSVLERVERDDHREILSRLVRESGLQGAPALKYMALRLCCEAGLRLPESPPEALASEYVSLVDQRARASFEPHREPFPLARKRA